MAVGGRWCPLVPAPSFASEPDQWGTRLPQATFEDEEAMAMQNENTTCLGESEGAADSLRRTEILLVESECSLLEKVL